jgi:hypothetical protein
VWVLQRHRVAGMSFGDRLLCQGLYHGARVCGVLHCVCLSVCLPV